MLLTEDQKTYYESVRRTALEELEALDRSIATELSRIKTRLLEIQEEKKAVKQILDGASIRLGLEVSPPVREINLSDLKRPVDQPSNAEPASGNFRSPIESPRT